MKHLHSFAEEPIVPDRFVLTIAKLADWMLTVWRTTPVTIETVGSHIEFNMITEQIWFSLGGAGRRVLEPGEIRNLEDYSFNNTNLRSDPHSILQHIIIK